ncbi:MAG TPA: alkaline phosphatase family protein, partial [Armatimonadota bacterium]|nr:alkaline phosphatase family protein [Armatimonadota bacterium]
MPPLLVVGIDGCPPALLDRWVAAGELPALASLISGGCFTVLRSTPNYQSASAWTSIVTGVNPGKHGILHFTNPVHGSYRLAQIDATARRAPTLWRLLSDAGLRVAALNFPVSYPAEPINGVQVAGWLAPTPGAPGFTHPPELAREIVRGFGRYPIHPDVRRHALAGNYRAVADLASRAVRHKARVARWLLRRERWDCFGVVFVETDSVQHWCWHLLDDTDPDHDPDLARRAGEVVLQVYRALDEELSGLVAAAGPDANVIVLSDHGQAANSGGQVFLRGWLRAAGYLVARPGQAPGGAGIRRRVLGALKDATPRGVKARLVSRFPGVWAGAQRLARGGEADWSRTRAWTETGHIFINLRGVWPEGIVEAGGKRDELLAEITDGLLSLEDADTGERVVAQVTRGDEQFSGPCADIMPDLLVHWRNDLRPRALLWRSPSRGPVTIPRPPSLTLPTGAHHPDGTLIAAGPAFASHHRPPAACVYDIAPTALHLLGLPVPSYMDGQVPAALLTQEALTGLRTVDMDPFDGTGDARPGAGDDPAVRARL